MRTTAALSTIFARLSRAFQNWFDERYRPQTKQVVGVRGSIWIGVGQLGISVVVIVALSFIGQNPLRLRDMAQEVDTQNERLQVYGVKIFTVNGSDLHL